MRLTLDSKLGPSTGQDCLPAPPPSFVCEAADREAEGRGVKGWWGGASGGPRGPSRAAPDHGLQGGHQADFHVQRVGAPEVDVVVDVTDDDVICQVEGVAVRGVRFVLLRWGRGRGTGREKLGRAPTQRVFSSHL